MRYTSEEQYSTFPIIHYLVCECTPSSTTCDSSSITCDFIQYFAQWWKPAPANRYRTAHHRTIWTPVPHRASPYCAPSIPHRV